MEKQLSIRILRHTDLGVTVTLVVDGLTNEYFINQQIISQEFIKLATKKEDMFMFTFEKLFHEMIETLRDKQLIEQKRPMIRNDGSNTPWHERTISQRAEVDAEIQEIERKFNEHTKNS